jgi:hypothetical protein
MKYQNKIFSLVLMIGVLISGCKKVENLAIPPLEAHFMFKSSDNFRVIEAGQKYKLPIGITTTASSERTIEVKITSPSGATEGTQYNVVKKSAVISAGAAVDTIIIEGILSAYTSGRKDTLNISIIETDNIKAIATNKQFTLYLAGPCFEGDVVLEELLGEYKNTNETLGTSAYGPYTTTITNVKRLSPTTGEITVANIYDFGWNPIKFILDWTDVNNRTVTLNQQSNIGPASTVFGSGQNGRDITVRNHPTAGPGTFSYCNNTLVLKIQIGVTELGVFASAIYTVNMGR